MCWATVASAKPSLVAVAAAELRRSLAQGDDSLIRSLIDKLRKGKTAQQNLLSIEDGLAVIRHQYFTISLPGIWQDHSDSNSFDFRCEDGKQQFTVSVSLATKTLSDQELLSSILSFYDARLKVLRELSQDKCTFSEKTLEEPEYGRVIFRRFCVDPVNRVDMYINLFGDKRKIVSATYFNYWPEHPKSDFKTRATDIIRQFVVT